MSLAAEILNGYKNYFIRGDKATEAEAKRRAAICAKCPHAKRGWHSAVLPETKLGMIKGLYCDLCGCPNSVKVRSMKTECPDNRW